eukprot:UN23255
MYPLYNSNDKEERMNAEFLQHFVPPRNSPEKLIELYNTIQAYRYENEQKNDCPIKLNQYGYEEEQDVNQHFENEKIKIDTFENNKKDQNINKDSSSSSGSYKELQPSWVGQNNLLKAKISPDILKNQWKEIIKKKKLKMKIKKNIARLHDIDKRCIEREENKYNKYPLLKSPIKTERSDANFLRN